MEKKTQYVRYWYSNTVLVPTGMVHSGTRKHAAEATENTVACPAVEEAVEATVPHTEKLLDYGTCAPQ